MGVRTIVIHRNGVHPDELARLAADFAALPNRVRLLTTQGDADIYALTPTTDRGHG